MTHEQRHSRENIERLWRLSRATAERAARRRRKLSSATVTAQERRDYIAKARAKRLHLERFYED